MSLNDIRLPDFIIGELYRDGLLVSPGSPQSVRQPAKPPEAPQPQTVQPAPSFAEPAAPAPLQSQTAQPSTASAERRGLKFLGNNRRAFTILVHSPGSAFLPDDQLAFLTKILEACRMNIGDVAIVNTATAPVTITGLKQQLRPAAILLFGLEPTSIRLPINFPAFRLQPYDDCTYLSVPSLDLLVQQSEESRLLKSKLWLCLKTLFNV